MSLLLLFAGGIAALILGANLLVRGASNLAATLGIPPLVIGLTVVAFGTSSPELAVSVQSAWSGQTDIAVGNVIGSNIFNVLLVLGSAAVIAPGGIPVAPAAWSFDLPFMIAVSLACVPVFFAGMQISRLEGGIFLLYYVAYVAFVVLDATDHAARPVFLRVMLAFVVPITVLTVLVLLARSRRSAQPGPAG